MSPTKGWGPTATALLLAFSLFFTFGCDRKDGDGAAANAADAPAATRNGSGDGSPPRRLPNVEVLRLVSRDFSLERTYIGHLIPFERVQLRAEIDGLVELADKGSLLLDEIGEMPMLLQAKLLRVLEDQMVRRIGGVKEFAVDIRVIAVTNRNLQEAVRAGAFRQDLYYRLNVIQIYIPTLRERPEDILPLVQFFIAHYNKKFKRKILGMSSEAEKLLQRYQWPGNVRELRNAIERAMILEDSSNLQVSNLPITLNRTEFPPVPTGVELPDSGLSLEETEREMISRALSKTGGNQTHAARLLSITRDTLRYKMKKFQLG